MSALGKGHRPGPGASPYSVAGKDVHDEGLTPHIPLLFERQVMESELASILREINDRQVSYFSTSTKYLGHAHEVASKAQVENQNLRAQVAELRKNVRFYGGSKDDMEALERHGSHASKLLVQKDSELREAKFELARLQRELEAMSRQPSRSVADSPQPSMQMSLLNVPHSSIDSDEPKPFTNVGESKESLLEEMRLPDQLYAVGNFVQEESSSEEEDIIRVPRASQIGAMGFNKQKTKMIGMLDIRDRMESMFLRRDHDPDELFWDTGCCQWIAKHPWFENASMAVIALNVIWIGIDTAHNPSDVLAYADPIFIIFEQLFCFLFTLELLIRFGAYKRKSDACCNLVMLFDAGLVLAMILETWIMFALALLTETSVDLFDPTFLRMLRLLRLSKAARIIRVLRSLPEIMILLKALGTAARSVFFTMCLLLIVIYIFAMAFTFAAKETASGEAYFSGLTHSMFTLFYIGCFGGNDLGTLAAALYEDHFLLGTMLLPYILFAPLTVLNLLTGILVEVVSAVAKTEKNYMDGQFITHALRGYLPQGYKHDKVRLEDLKMVLGMDEALDTLHEGGIDVLGLAEDPEIIFETKTTELTFREFVDRILLLKVTNPATLKDVLQSRHAILEEMKASTSDALAVMNQGLKSMSKKGKKQRGMR